MNLVSVPLDEFALWRWPARCIICLDLEGGSVSVPPQSLSVDLGAYTNLGQIRASFTATVPQHSIPYCASHLAGARATDAKQVLPPIFVRSHGFRDSVVVQRPGLETQVACPESYVRKEPGVFPRPPDQDLRVRLTFSNDAYAVAFARENATRFLALLTRSGERHFWPAVVEALPRVAEPSWAPALVQVVRDTVSWAEKRREEAVARMRRGASWVVRGRSWELNLGLDALFEGVIAVLGTFGPEAALGPVLEAVSDPNPSVRRHMATALGVLRDPQGLRSLIGAAREEPDSEVRTAAILALGQGFPEDAAALDALEGAAREDPDRAVRKKAAKVLKKARL